MFRFKSLHPLMVFVTAACLSSLALAGTVRHDLVEEGQIYWWEDSPYVVLGASPEYASVGQFYGIATLDPPWGGSIQYEVIASGVLITPDTVLTAGHVMDLLPMKVWNTYTDESAVVRPQWESLGFYINGYLWGDGQGDPVSSRVAHPKWSQLASGVAEGDPADYTRLVSEAMVAGYDIGLAKLPSPVPGVQPATRYTGSKEVGKVGTSAGWGISGTGLTGEGAYGYDYLKRAGTNMIDAYAPGPGKYDWLPGPGKKKDARLLFSDFDSPDDRTKSLWRSPKPTDLEFLIASGDSGGGLFIDDKGGENLLAGIHSFVGSFGADWSVYGDLSGHTRVAAFNDWIDEVLASGFPGVEAVGDAEAGWPLAMDIGATFHPAATPLPEPSTLSLLALAGLCLLGSWWRTRKR